MGISTRDGVGVVGNVRCGCLLHSCPRGGWRVVVGIFRFFFPWSLDCAGSLTLACAPWHISYVPCMAVVGGC